jgi:methylmalonyl-CoA mutase N-terminal domain/subunit
MNHFMEIAKMRAARMLWAKIVKTFDPKIKSHGFACPFANIWLEFE